MFTEHWKFLALSAACKLNLFDKILAGQNTIDKLLDQSFYNEYALDHLLTFLINDGYLLSGNNQDFTLSEKGNLLRKHKSDGLYFACLNWSAEHLTAWQKLDYSITTGESAFEHLFRMPFFDYLNEHPVKLRNYQMAMYQYAIDDYKDLPKRIDFSVHHVVMDVGGGYGAAIHLIKQQSPNLRCILFDLEKVVHEVHDGTIEKLAGNFFEAVPKISDAIILSRVIHDWNDNMATLILSNCYKALPDSGTLYLIENCMDRIKSDLSLLSLNMSAMCQSHERSLIQYVQLCEQEGFTYDSEQALNQLQTILIFKK